MRRRVEWIQEGSPIPVLTGVGTDGNSARYPARTYDRTFKRGSFLKTNPGGTAGVDALVPEWTGVFFIFRPSHAQPAGITQEDSYERIKPRY